MSNANLLDSILMTAGERPGSIRRCAAAAPVDGHRGDVACRCSGRAVHIAPTAWAVYGMRLLRGRCRSLMNWTASRTASWVKAKFLMGAPASV